MQFAKSIPEEHFTQVLRGESVIEMMIQAMQNEIRSGSGMTDILMGRTTYGEGWKEFIEKYFQFDGIESLNLRLASGFIGEIRESFDRQVREIMAENAEHDFARANCPALCPAFREMARFFSDRLVHDYLKLYYYQQEDHKV